jgi:hypothetical protein
VLPKLEKAERSCGIQKLKFGCQLQNVQENREKPREMRKQIIRNVEEPVGKEGKKGLKKEG